MLSVSEKVTTVYVNSRCRIAVKGVLNSKKDIYKCDYYLDEKYVTRGGNRWHCMDITGPGLLANRLIELVISYCLTRRDDYGIPVTREENVLVRELPSND
jgi:hypothetical protein